MAKLFTADIDKKLFEQYKFGGDLSKQEVVAKVFNPYSNGTWYLLNSDPQDPDYIWAIVDMFDVEIGSVSRNDLETMKVPPFELHLERDKFFQPMNAQILYLRLRGGEKFEEGGEVSNRISEMVKHWNKCGWAISNINNDDSEFFKRIGKSYIDTATTSFSGNDINYYDADRVEVAGGSFKQKFATGGTTDCGCHKMEEGGSMDYKNKLGLVKVKFKNPKYNYSTNVSATTTEKDARKYFVGQMFNVGSYPREIMREVVDIEFYEKGTYAEGGEIANSNNEMLQSQLKAVEHHAKELSSIVNDKTPVEAWVVGKIERASTDLSDITHYLDGQNFADGGEIKNQYAGKTAEQVWNSWDKDQRIHFITDHYDYVENIYDKDLMKEFYELELQTRAAIEMHVDLGQYAKGGTIETDTPILVGMVAENVARYKYFEKNNVPKQNQPELIKKADETIAKLEKHLEQKANTVYKNNEMFKKQLNQKGNKGRDSLYMYMEHWSDAYLGNKYAKSGEKYAKGGGIAEIDMDSIEKSAKFYTDKSRWSVPPTISKFENEITEYKELRIKLDNKQITPSKIIGTGFKPNYARPLAYKWIDEHILIAKRAIELLKESGEMMAKGGGLSRSQKQYNKEVDAYKYFIVDLKNKKAISGWEYRDDANEALIDYDGDKNYKVVAEVTLKSLGIENPKESFKKMAMGGKVKFSDKVKAVKASLLKTKKVSPKVQKDYGKTYSPKEAEQAAKRIVGSRTAKWNERISNNK